MSAIKKISVADHEYQQVLKLRDEILRQPLGMSIYNDVLTKDKDEVILVAIDSDIVVGCVMLKKIGAHTGKLRQMAVAETQQGNGIGRLLMIAAEVEARTMGYHFLELNARKTAVSFYKTIGYKVEGDEFIEVGVPHFFMKKHLHENIV